MADCLQDWRQWIDFDDENEYRARGMTGWWTVGMEVPRYGICYSYCKDAGGVFESNAGVKRWLKSKGCQANFLTSWFKTGYFDEDWRLF